MSEQTLTLTIPDPLYRRLRDDAARSNRSVEAEIVDRLASTVSANDECPPVGTIEWGRMNQRRAALIRKKNREGLTAEEQAEYERLQLASRNAFPNPPTDEGWLAQIMNIPTTIPVTVTPEAAAHVAALGLEPEFEQMIAYSVRNVPGLLRLDVTVEPPYDTGDDDAVVFQGYRDPAVYPSRNPDRDEWSCWKYTTFQPDVSRHFTFLL